MHYLRFIFTFPKLSFRSPHQQVKKNNYFGFLWGFCVDFLGNQTRMNFPTNRMGIDTLRTDPESTGAKKKNNIFFYFLGGFAWIFSDIKRE